MLAFLPTPDELMEQMEKQVEALILNRPNMTQEDYDRETLKLLKNIIDQFTQSLAELEQVENYIQHLERSLIT